MSDWSKIFYLEIIDATFSIDGVIGAFAFTLSVPLILIGNGIGAFVVREVTIRHVDQVRKYPFLKNGAMYSIAFLGVIMLLDSFGFHIPVWVSPIITFAHRRVLPVEVDPPHRGAGGGRPRRGPAGPVLARRRAAPGKRVVSGSGTSNNRFCLFRTATL